jgi:glycosyltransferase involved in cell wall biosynthesis
VHFVLRAIFAALRSRPDLIVCGHINVAGLAWAIAAITRSRSALLAYGIEAWAPPVHARWAARRMARVLPVSRFTAEQMRTWGICAERIHLLPGTVDGQSFRPIRRDREHAAPTLLTIARLATSERYKGIDRVLAVLPRVRRALSGTRYVVAGEGDDLPRLRSLAKNLGIADATEFLGFVSEDELLGLYNAADLFVMPSVKEGFGIVFLEAMACGTPVVAGNVDGSVDALLGGRLGRLVDPNDDTALIDAIVEGLASRRTQGVRERIRDGVLAEYGFDRFRTRVGEALTGA